MDTSNGTDWHLWGLAGLEAMPDLTQAQYDNLKVDSDLDGTRVRVWLSRMTVADGAPYDHGVTVQTLREDGDWETVAEYPAAGPAAEDEEDDAPTYEIVRFYAGDFGPDIIATGVTLEEAQEHCNDRETSSKTATGAEAVARTAECGPWFDGYREE